MHHQRRYLSLAIVLACCSYLLNWLSLTNGFYWTGLYFGYTSLFSLIIYVSILVIVLIDISNRPLSKQRLIVLGFITFFSFLWMLQKAYTVFERFKPQDKTIDVVGAGLVLFACSNLFILIYVAYSYKNDYILPQVDESVLDSNMNG